MLVSKYILPINSGSYDYVVVGKNIAQKMGLKPQDRIILTNPKDKDKHTLCFAEINEAETKKNSIGIPLNTYQKVKKGLNLKFKIQKEGNIKSLDYIKAKLDGKKLTENEFQLICRDIVDGNLNDAELAFFVSGCYINQLNFKEAADLTKAIADNGFKLSFKANQIVADKHCIGGVPGNRTTMVVIPIIASLGIKIPKTSSRSISSPAGTADTMEVLSEINLNQTQLENVIKKTNGFIAWGGGCNLAASDDELIRVRRKLGLDPQGLVLASVMAKKYAAGATHVLIDIPYGKFAKVATLNKAEEMKEKFEKIGKELGLKMKVLITKGNQTIGRGIGPRLEAIDVLQVLNNDPSAPKDLLEKSCKVAGQLLELLGKAKINEGYTIAKKQIENNQAYQKFQEIIQAQGAKKMIPKATYQIPILAPKSGKIKEFNIKTISKIAKLAGSPKSPNSGMEVLVKLKDQVEKKQIIYIIHTNQENFLTQAIKDLIQESITII